MTGTRESEVRSQPVQVGSFEIKTAKLAISVVLFLLPDGRWLAQDVDDRTVRVFGPSRACVTDAFLKGVMRDDL